jgi:hypothetical protein
MDHYREPSFQLISNPAGFSCLRTESIGRLSSVTDVNLS